jgi:catechol 2,3-dioxygenase-like lactoylglutathione lyase family enzyme
MFLEHANMTVSDLDRSINFYSTLLGLGVRWQGTTNDGSPAAHVGDDRCYLALFQATAPGKPPNDYASPGLNHIGFVVDNLDAARTRVAELGAQVHAEMDYEPGRRVYLFDPDGIEVELVEYANARA